VSGYDGMHLIYSALEKSRGSTEGDVLVGAMGGLPIWRGAELQGAIGVSGASNNQADEDCARAGIVALNIE
jgi:uncharacterized protein GlcG (DUF336 family)